MFKWLCNSKCVTEEELDNLVKARFEKEIRFKKNRKSLGFDENDTSIEVYPFKPEFCMDYRVEYFIVISNHRRMVDLIHNKWQLYNIEKVLNDGRIEYRVQKRTLDY